MASKTFTKVVKFTNAKNSFVEQLRENLGDSDVVDNYELEKLEILFQNALAAVKAERQHRG